MWLSEQITFQAKEIQVQRSWGRGGPGLAKEEQDTQCHWREMRKEKMMGPENLRPCRSLCLLTK